MEIPFEDQADFLILHPEAKEYHEKVDEEYMELSVDFPDNPEKGFRTNVNIVDQQSLPQKLNKYIKTFPCTDEKKEFIETEYMKIFGSENSTFSLIRLRFSFKMDAK